MMPIIQKYKKCVMIWAVLEYKVKKTNIKEIIFDIRKESDPCPDCVQKCAAVR